MSDEAVPQGDVPEAAAPSPAPDGYQPDEYHRHDEGFSCADRDSYVFAVGRIACRFPDPGVEKEFTQVVGGSKTRGKTDDQVLREVVGRPENRYLARQLQFVLIIQGVETYTVVPRFPEDYEKLIDALRPQPSPLDLDVVIGVRVPSGGSCGGLALPVVEFYQLYSFSRPVLFDAIEKPDGMSAKRFRATADAVLTKILQITENAGATAPDRAANYVACRYEAVYLKTFEAFAADYALTSIEVGPAAVGGDQGVMNFVVSYTGRKTDITERYAVQVATRHMNPYLLTHLGPSL
ncbi:hypothetical protein ABZ714_28100 [Streptomyces sp. NPDC006798]|uniref:cyanobactin maturation protease PatG family protein n=1 Tax=Streptomyces sp. NPDC006798 TaxID=3155462 RepID=UPI0033D5E4E1